ncbi:hypothetical protein D9757_001742 [Collybiopsis confluens]|uniref:Uncharacterized protein n=1 Tax=Collybiopsis confluens TaxID=2823264 RepID=A0A8H5HYJ2_9AGAR|nr:hypothetical protein D9757_001742 [Collybiopsis confluens]
MSARQNFTSYHHNYNPQNRTSRERPHLNRNGKRIHRDRTVTTLTGQGEDDSEFFSAHRNLAGEQANQSQNFPNLSPAISTPSSANFNQFEPLLMPPTANFPFNGFVAPMNPNTNVQLAQPGPNSQAFLRGNSHPHLQHQSMLPLGKNDLEILENLKDRIKKGQHEFFRATPTPAALASLYLGPNGIVEQQIVTITESDPHAQQALGYEALHLNVNDAHRMIKRASSSTPVSDNSSKMASVQEIKENGSKSMTDVVLNGSTNNSNPSLPAKPAAGTTSANGIKDERPLGRETYPLPTPAIPQSALGAPKYYDPRDTRESRDSKDTRDDREADNHSTGFNNPRRGPSGAEYASIRYGPIRDIRDAREDRDRDRKRSDSSHYEPSYRREEYPPPPPLPPPSIDEYRRPSLPPANERDRFYPPSSTITQNGDDRDRYDRIPPPPPTPPLPPPASSYSVPSSSSSYDRYKPAYDDSRQPSSYPAPSNAPSAGHQRLATHSSRYNENRQAIGESPVAAAAAAEREAREREKQAGLTSARPRALDDRSRATSVVDDREYRDREYRDRDNKSTPPKLEERISGVLPNNRGPSLQERLAHPPADGPQSASSRLSLEERLGPSTPAVLHPLPSSNATATSASPAKGPVDSTSSSSVMPSSIGSSVTITPASASIAAGSGMPSIPPKNYNRAPSLTREDRDRDERRESLPIEAESRYSRYPSPTLSERERRRVYPSPPSAHPVPYDNRDRDHRRAISEDRRRDWPEEDSYYRPSSSSASRVPLMSGSVYPPPSPYNRDPRPMVLRTDHERRISSSSASATITTPPRGGGIDDRDRSYRPTDLRYPPSSVGLNPSSAAPAQVYSRVRPRSPSPNTTGPGSGSASGQATARRRPISPPASTNPATTSTNYSQHPGSYSNANPSTRRLADYPLSSHLPPPVGLPSTARDTRDSRDAYYPPPAPREYPPPATYDRPRSPVRSSVAYGGGYSRDMRDPRDARDIRDQRDSRDIRDHRDVREIRDPRDIRDLRDLRDPRDDGRRYMPPPPLPR